MPITAQKQINPLHKRMEAINDQLFSIVRLLETCGGSVPPPIVDVVAIAIRKVHTDYTQVAYEARQIAMNQEGPDHA